MTAPSIAVLPFANLSGEPDKDYFTDGLAEGVAHTLAPLRALRIAAHASGLVFKGGTLEPREIAKRLGVETVLEGGVRRAGDQLQVTVRLVAVSDGAERWAARHDRPLADVFAVLAEISAEVARALGLSPTDAEQRAMARSPTTDVLAYDSYMQGRQLTHQLLRRSQDSARILFEQAIAQDAAFARAHAGLANSHAMMFQYWDSSEANVRAADRASGRAVELGPDLADTHVARGLASSLAKRFDEAHREFATALELRPDSFDACYFLARSYRAEGTMTEAARWFERACALRPEDYATRQLMSSVYTSLGRTEESRALQRQALELAEEQLERNPDDARALYLAAGALATLGDSARARQWAKRAVAMDPDDSAVLYNVACAYAILRLTDSAIDCLEQAVANGFGHWQWIEHDSDLDSLRGHPRFKALLAQKAR